MLMSDFEDKILFLLSVLGLILLGIIFYFSVYFSVLSVVEPYEFRSYSFLESDEHEAFVYRLREEYLDGYKSHDKIKGLVDEIEEVCVGVDCKVGKVDEFISEHLTHSDDKEGVFTFDEVLERGEGDCIEKALIFISVFEKLDINSFFALQKNHICVFYESGFNDFSSFNCFTDRGFVYFEKGKGF